MLKCLKTRQMKFKVYVYLSKIDVHSLYLLDLMVLTLILYRSTNCDELDRIEQGEAAFEGKKFSAHLLLTVTNCISAFSLIPFIFIFSFFF